MNIFSRILAAIRPTPIPDPPEIRTDANGLALYRDGEVLAAIEWSDVRRIAAYKHDLFIVDEICVAFEYVSSEGTWLEISEEFSGYKDCMKAVLQMFPEIPEGWFSDVAFPAFETNYSVLWKADTRSSDGGP